MKTRRVGILGHFSFGKDLLNGQTIKTKVIADELDRVLGQEEVIREDTHGGWRFFVRLPFAVSRLLWRCRNVIIAPAYKAVFIISPVLVGLNTLFGRSLHFVTIGGRLPQILRRHAFMRCVLRRFDVIYAETDLVRKELEALGMRNVEVMPNCKPLPIVAIEEGAVSSSEPLRLCTFSRVTKTKGIEDAVAAVVACNSQLGREAFTLDIYGQVEEPQWFEQLMQRQPSFVQYKGMVPYDGSSSVLCSYFLLLFPTFYPGECFAGTLIDALAAGLPVLASDWRSNGEIVEDGITGFLFPPHDVGRLTDLLLQVAGQPSLVTRMRKSCVARADDYQPAHVLQRLESHFA